MLSIVPGVEEHTLCVLQSIGFDMDYTLSQYRPETFEVLAYNLTIEKLVKNFHYPKVRLGVDLLCACARFSDRVLHHCKIHRNLCSHKHHFKKHAPCITFQGYPLGL